MKNSKWTNKQDQFIVENYTKMTRKEIAEQLGKTLDSVNKRMSRHLKLNKNAELRKSMVGKIFGLLKVLEFSHIENKTTLYKCECECGNIKNVGYDSLISGNTSSCGCLRRKNLEETQHKAMFEMYRYSASKRNIEFNLDFLVFKKITFENCFYCGNEPVAKPLPFNYKKNGISDDRAIVVNGIDRYNNDEGYFEKNCVACCSECNFMKQDMSGEQFLGKIRKIYINKAID